MAYAEEKNKATAYAGAASSPYEPFANQPRVEALPELEKKDQAYKRRIRILRFCSRVTSLVLSALMTAILAYTLTCYFLTKHHILPHGTAIWITPTTLWPTIMLLSISTITFFINFATLCAYFCGVSCANKVGSFGNVVEYVMLVGKVVAWAIAAGLFRMAKTNNSIWGWTCNDTTQTKVNSFLDFGHLCDLQTSSWYISIAETIGYLLTFIIYVFVARRRFTKKMIKERTKQGSFQLGNVPYKLGVGQQRYIPLSGAPPVHLNS